MTSPYLVNKMLAKHGCIARIERNYKTKDYSVVVGSGKNEFKLPTVIKGPNLKKVVTSRVYDAVQLLLEDS